jgi:hypothetical protein
MGRLKPAKPKVVHVFLTARGTLLCTLNPEQDTLPGDTILGEYVPRRKRKPKTQPLDTRQMSLYTSQHEDNSPAQTEGAVLDLGASQVGEHKQEANASSVGDSSG